MVACSIGKKVNSVEEAHQYIEKVQGFMIDQERQNSDHDYDQKGQSSPLYIIAMPI